MPAATASMNGTGVLARSMAGGAGRPASDLQHHLEGVDYPADKQGLIEAAQRNNAPDEVIDEIRDLPDQEFGGPHDVTKAYARR